MYSSDLGLYLAGTSLGDANCYSWVRLQFWVQEGVSYLRVKISLGCGVWAIRGNFHRLVDSACVSALEGRENKMRARRPINIYVRGTPLHNNQRPPKSTDQIGILQHLLHGIQRRLKGHIARSP